MTLQFAGFFDEKFKIPMPFNLLEFLTKKIQNSVTLIFFIQNLLVHQVVGT